MKQQLVTIAEALQKATDLHLCELLKEMGTPKNDLTNVYCRQLIENCVKEFDLTGTAFPEFFHKGKIKFLIEMEICKESARRYRQFIEKGIEFANQ
jgi:hypothetical protein